MAAVSSTRSFTRSFTRALYTCAACCLLWACDALPPAAGTAPATATSPATAASSSSAPTESIDLAASYLPLRALPGQVLRLQPAASRMRIYVFRGGRAGGLGHSHVLSAPQFEGYAFLPDKGLDGARLDLLFRLDQLVFDVPAQRLEAGAAFASVLSEAAIEATREHMLGENNMQAQRYPLVRIHALDISGEAPFIAARLAITLHGQTREMTVPVELSAAPQQLTLRGALVLRQSDFGVQPYSVMNGLLAVQDAVRLEFSLVGSPL